MTRTLPLALVLSATLLTSACQMSRTQERVLTGAAIGAGVGAGIGALSGGLDMGTGAVIGGLVGAGGGLVYDAVKK
jgi:hypothetical protein